MRPVMRKTVFALLALAILMGLVFRFRGAALLGGFNWQRLFTAASGANVPLLLLSIAAIYACYAIRSLRWMRFSRYMGHPTFPHVYSATLMGFAAVFLLGRAGEPVRPLLIARKDQLPVADSFGVYVLDRIFDTGITAILACFALLSLPRDAAPGEQNGPLVRDARLAGVVLLIGLVVIALLLIYFRLRGARSLAPRLHAMSACGGWRAKLAWLISGFGEGLQAIRSPADLALALGYTIVHWLLVAAVYLWVCWAFRGQLANFDFRAALIVLVFTMVGSVIQLPAVGGGTQVATFLVLTVIFGVEKEAAAAVAIALWVITFAAVCLAGVPLLIREGWSMGDLRHLVREEAAAEARGTHAVFTRAAKRSGEIPR